MSVAVPEARGRLGKGERPRLRRLLEMSLPELACRSREAIHRRIERATAGPKPHWRRRATARADDGASLEGLGRRFFAGPFDPGVPGRLWAERPRACHALLSAADRILEGRFDLLGYADLRFGTPVDWHLDPVSGRRAPRQHWTRIDPLDHAAAGDSKVVWELNRHQWLVRLGQAYRLSGDRRYADACATHLGHWLDANPAGFGINWTSSLELALRLMAWCWTIALIRDAGALTGDLRAALVAAIRTHARHVERYLSRYFSPNTHLTGEALGLFYAGWVLPDGREARRWRRLGARLLDAQGERQILADGVHFEQATCYQRYTADIYLHYVILARRNGLDVPSLVVDRLRRLLDALLVMRRPDGSSPNVGDDDGGRLLPLGPIEGDDFGATLSTAAAVFGQRAYAWAAGEPAPDTRWLLGTESPWPGGERPGAPPSRLFPVGGQAVMRSGWESDAHYLLFDAGPLGCPVSGAHGHADLLSLQCAAFGAPLLVDAGTGCYTADPAWRRFFRSTAAHSTVTVDDVGQACPTGPFAWDRRPAARRRQWRSTARYDFADAEHEAYHGLPDPVTHRRRVVFVKPDYFVVIDDLDGRAAHQIDLRFQFAPADVELRPDGWVRATVDSERGLWLRAFAARELTPSIRTGRADPLEGWVSRGYGQVEPAPAVVWTARGGLPLRVIACLWPERPIGRRPPAVRLVLDADGQPGGLAIETRGETLRLTGERREPIAFDRVGVGTRISTEAPT